MDLAIQWEHIEREPSFGEKWEEFWTPLLFKQVMDKWQTQLAGKGWNALYLSSLDQPRQASRFGNDQKYRVESAKMPATCIHLMQGTPFVYRVRSWA